MKTIRDYSNLGIFLGFVMCVTTIPFEANATNKLSVNFGTILAHDFIKAIKSGKFDPRTVSGRCKILSEQERLSFLFEWRALTDPMPVALEVAKECGKGFRNRDLAWNFATGTERLKYSGIELNSLFRSRLKSGLFELDRALAGFSELGFYEKEAFLNEWQHMRKVSDIARQLYSRAFAEYDRMAQRGPPKIRLGPEAMESRLYNNSLNLIDAQIKSKSIFTAWFLSFFFGLGTGNFYVEQPAVGGMVLVGQLTGIVLWLTGLSDPLNVTMTYIGSAITSVSWLADWISALHGATAHNQKLLDRVQYDMQFNSLPRSRTLHLLNISF